ncbi:MAG: hypothetical protein Kow0069_31020 [Promethearchaeota archaeon]
MSFNCVLCGAANFQSIRGVLRHLRAKHPSDYHAWVKGLRGLATSLAPHVHLDPREREALRALQERLVRKIVWVVQDSDRPLREQLATSSEPAIGVAVKDGRVKELVLRNLGLTEVPEAVMEFRELVRLDLSDNQIHEIPQELWSVPFLDLEGNPLKLNNPWLNREYYMRCFGFDPIEDKHASSGRFYYEETHELQNDPELHALGVTITARVEFDEDDYFTGPQPHNSVVFRRPDGREAEVDCIHTAVYSVGLGELEKILEDDDSENRLLEMAFSTEMRPVDLPPEEHFVALKSFVAGVASMGLSNLLGASYHSEEVNPETLPIGFNDALQRQVCRCLREVAPEAFVPVVRKVLLAAASSSTPRWFLRRLELFDRMYFGRIGFRNWPISLSPEILKALFEDGAFEEFDRRLGGDREFRLLAYEWAPGREPGVVEVADEINEEFLKQLGEEPSPVTAGLMTKLRNFHVKLREGPPCKARTWLRNGVVLSPRVALFEAIFTFSYLMVATRNEPVGTSSKGVLNERVRELLEGSWKEPLDALGLGAPERWRDALEVPPGAGEFEEDQWNSIVCLGVMTKLEALTCSNVAFEFLRRTGLLAYSRRSPRGWHVNGDVLPGLELFFN